MGGKARETGPGFAVVKRIVEAHVGSIGFEGEEGKGRRFTVTLAQTAD
ncbi:MAG: ATP-binding protein [Halobacteriota archaeon]